MSACREATPLSTTATRRGPIVPVEVDGGLLTELIKSGLLAEGESDDQGEIAKALRASARR